MDRLTAHRRRLVAQRLDLAAQSLRVIPWGARIGEGFPEREARELEAACCLIEASAARLRKSADRAGREGFTKRAPRAETAEETEARLAANDREAARVRTVEKKRRTTRKRR